MNLWHWNIESEFMISIKSGRSWNSTKEHIAESLYKYLQWKRTGRMCYFRKPDFLVGWTVWIVFYCSILFITSYTRVLAKSGYDSIPTASLFRFLRLDLFHVELELLAFEEIAVRTSTLSGARWDCSCERKMCWISKNASVIISEYFRTSLWKSV